MIKLIIFDIGGVLIDYTYKEYVRLAAARLQVDREELKKVLLPRAERLEYGSNNLDQFEGVIAKRFKVSKRSLRWAQTYKRAAKVNRKMIRLLNSLSKRYKVVLLSNVNVSLYLIGLRLLRGLHVDKVFGSCYLGMRKPDPRIYRYVLKKMGVKPGEALFIDNLEENVAGARRAGIRSEQFTGYVHLIRTLRELGVLDSAAV